MIRVSPLIAIGELLDQFFQLFLKMQMPKRLMDFGRMGAEHWELWE